jgi:hypothetical protein
MNSEQFYHHRLRTNFSVGYRLSNFSSGLVAAIDPSVIKSESLRPIPKKSSRTIIDASHKDTVIEAHHKGLSWG